MPNTGQDIGSADLKYFLDLYTLLYSLNDMIQSAEEQWKFREVILRLSFYALSQMAHFTRTCSSGVGRILFWGRTEQKWVGIITDGVRLNI